ncbi:MAG: NAD-dependent epimerase/dehydratase family protein [Verrucomicrobiae bacterium]|nr:NAD-dependent epimerase/dehydratase family protein [Verrucomicrobiae bacterium]
MKLHVLGGEGFVGSAFVRVARNRGHVVGVITRKNYSRFCGKPCDIVINANGNSKKFLADRDPIREFEASVVSVQRSLLDFPCKRYVYLSSIDVYPHGDDPKLNHERSQIKPEQLSRYGLHKYLAERVVRHYAPRWLIVRLGGMVGEHLWKNSIYDILHGGVLRVHIDSEYQYLSTDDAARIVLTLARKQPANDIFNVCGDGCISLRGVTSLITGWQLRYATNKPQKEHYEISVTKLRSWMKVPLTRSTVRKFIRRQHL